MPWNALQGGDIVTDAQERQERTRQVIRKLQRAWRNDMECLAGWEIELLLEYIKKLERNDRK
jgi:hypothetical protein